MPMTHGPLTVSAAAAGWPVTLPEAKDHLRVDATADDALIRRLIGAATTFVETRLGRQLVNATLKLELDEFPANELWLPRPPLSSVSSIKYYDTGNTQQTLASSEYEVDASSEPGRVRPTAASSGWPSTYDRLNAVEILFVAGYGATTETVPEDIRQAILFVVGHWYENREATIVGKTTPEIELALRSITWANKAFIAA